MGLETGTYVSDLVETNPVGATDERRFGDDHLRLIKSVLKATFPDASAAFRFPRFTTITSSTTIAAADEGKIFMVDSAGGDVTLTLPSTGSLAVGWTVHHRRSRNTGGDQNAQYIVPVGGGSINGFTRIRRQLPFVTTSLIWDGTRWEANRPMGSAIGARFSVIAGFTPTGNAISQIPGAHPLNGASLSSSEFAEFINVTGLTSLPTESGVYVVVE